jgi:glycosyltransferase involved in cell wall biosynthesis
MSELISIIVSTYNWPAALRLVLDSLIAQTDSNFEVIIADDGSGPLTREVIQEAQALSHISIIHVWQEDLGFRVARARNQATLRASGSLLFFMDGDCLLERGFITRLRAIMRPGYFVAGNRVLLTQAFTQEVLESRTPIYRFNFWRWMHARGVYNRAHPFLKLPLGPLRRWVRNRWQGAKGCNLAIWKKDYWAVNGFDESFEGWGYEDSDLVVRLQHLGVKRMTGRFACPVIHLWHPENDRGQERSNWNRLQQTLKNNQVKAKQGVSECAENLL